MWHNKKRNGEPSKYGLLDMNYTESHIVGINGKPLVDLSHLMPIDMSDIHIEICKGMTLFPTNKAEAVAIGIMPPDLSAEYDNRPFEAELLNNLEEIDPTGKHAAVIETMTVDERRQYLKYALGLNAPWSFAYYLMPCLYKNNNGPNQWNSISDEFPLTKSLITSMPFKHLGKVLVFCSLARTGVSPHRDHPMEDHKGHQCNIFPGGTRPSYVYDAIDDVKIYVPENVKAYTFNDRDFHGVDPEPTFNYTLRVDGTWTDEFAESLGLVDGIIKATV